MIPLYTTAQVKELDKFAVQELGVPGTVLMENASIGIVEALKEKIELISGKIQFGFVCGKGNNGGDGYALARHLSNLGYTVKIISLGSQKHMTDDCRLNYNILKKLSGQRKNISIKKFNSVKDLKFLSKSQVIIDAMLGTGVAGLLKPPYNEIINHLNSLKKIRVAVDIPTGLNADSGYGDNIFKADFCVTLGEYKRGLFFSHGTEYAGEIILKEIGIGRDFFKKVTVNDYLIEPEDVFEALPEKTKSLHKYSSGKVLVIAGSEKFPGAAVLTSQAALKSGAGSVILAFPESPRKLIQRNLTEVVFEAYKSEKNVLTRKALKSFNDKIKWSDVVAVGPGIDRDDDTVDAVRQLIRIRKNKTIVLDADGIYAIGNSKYKLFNLKNVILTPHLGEFSYLINLPITKIKKDILSYGKAFSIQTESYLVLKGSPTIIFTPNGEALINSTGNPGMAKFGTGDVLTGMIASFIAQTKNIEDGLLLGVYLHSLAADLLLSQKTEFGILATDIVKNIPKAIEFIRKCFDKLS